ncbi:MAG: DNA-protecting protein DprA, partial [Kiritimatiellaceae bacterium]|nr:DNA-protecting protein DprA [Kiritimatiellaceae bacterium]
MTDREAYIALNMIEGIGPIKVQALIEALGSPQAVFDPNLSDFRNVKGIGEKLSESILAQRFTVDIQAEIDRAKELGVQIITPLDADYPAALKA